MQEGVQESQTPPLNISDKSETSVPFCLASPPPSQDGNRVDDPSEARNLAPPSSGGNPTNEAHAAPSCSSSEAEEATQNRKNQDHKQTSTRQRTRRRTAKAKAIAPPTIEELFGVSSDAWTRFYAMSIAGDLDNVEIYDELSKTLKDDFDCYRRKDGAIIVDAKTKRNSEAIQNLTKLLDREVTTLRDPRLNSVRGTILVPLREFRNQEDLDSRIYNHLERQNIPVSSVKIFKKTSRKNITLTCACITFESRTLPSVIRIGFEQVKVKEDIPNPRQCRGCWRFGHTVDNCRSPPCCPICGNADHDFNNCAFKGDKTYKGHCPNCNEKGHTAFSKMCDLYRKESEILAIMYRQGLPKNKARRVVEEMGLFAGISYAKRAARKSSPDAATSQSNDQQQPPDHQSPIFQPPSQAPLKQPAQDTQQSPENLLEALFESELDPFLSVEAESVEICSSEEHPPQTHQNKQETGQKRKPEEAFPHSPTDESQAHVAQANKRKNDTEAEPQSTSSPRKPSQSPKSSKQKTVGPEPPSPMSRVVTLGEGKGAIQKKKAREKEDDGQHRNEDDCGCHQCIKKLSIIRMEDILPGKEMSKKLREQVDKRRIYKNTALKLHPNPCLCKTHLGRSHPTSTTTITSKTESLTESRKGQVSNLRSKFEEPARVDPRTGMPPKPDKCNNSSPIKIIPVHTSR